MSEKVFAFTRKDLAPSWKERANGFAHGDARGASDATKLALAEHIQSMPSGAGKEEAPAAYKFVCFSYV